MSAPDRLYFTEDDEANALIASDPMALLVGFALDQQVTVQKAFMGPLVIQERLGVARRRRRSPTPTSTRCSAIRPAVHRFPGAMAQRVHDLAVHIRDEYDGDAARVWTDATTQRGAAREPRGRCPGFGEMKVKSMGSVLFHHYGLEIARDLVPWHPTLGVVESPEGLADYQAKKKIHKAEWSKPQPA